MPSKIEGCEYRHEPTPEPLDPHALLDILCGAGRPPPPRTLQLNPARILSQAGR